jgi:hypothetical protein
MKKLEIVDLETDLVEINHPTTRDEWSDILEAALQARECQKTQDILKATEGNLVNTDNKIGGNISGLVNNFTHCECKILQHFITKDLEPKPLSYIGVSKLACAGCSTVFRIWNNLNHDKRYLCRGSHGKWYFPWAMPGLDKSNIIANATYEDIADKFANSMVNEDQKYYESDSTAPSVEDGPIIIWDLVRAVEIIDKSHNRRDGDLRFHKAVRILMNINL